MCNFLFEWNYIFILCWQFQIFRKEIYARNSLFSITIQWIAWITQFRRLLSCSNLYFDIKKGCNFFPSHSIIIFWRCKTSIHFNNCEIDTLKSSAGDKTKTRKRVILNILCSILKWLKTLCFLKYKISSSILKSASFNNVTLCHLHHE